MKNIGNITLAAWLVTFLLGYFGVGSYLYELMEGMDLNMVPKAPVVLFVIGLLASITLSVMWARNMSSSQIPAPTGRRKFLMGGAAVTGGVIGATAAIAGKLAPWMQSKATMDKTSCA